MTTDIDQTTTAVELISRVGQTLLIKRDQQELGRGSDCNPYFDYVQSWQLEKMLRDVNVARSQTRPAATRIIAAMVDTATRWSGLESWLSWELDRLDEDFGQWTS